jgi:cytidine deaminase
MILIYSNYKKRKDIIIMKKRLISFMLLITVISCAGFNTDYFKNLLTLISQAAKEVIYEETESYDEETTDSAADRLEQELEKLDVRNLFEKECETESGRITIPSLQQMHDAVTQWARMEESLANSNRQLDKFNTATVVYDARTGNYYYGMNRGVQLSGDTLNLSLESWLPESSLNQYRLGNCAEVDAVNQALNSGANASDLYLYTINTKNNVSKPMCENCIYTFGDRVADVLSH